MPNDTIGPNSSEFAWELLSGGCVETVGTLRTPTFPGGLDETGPIFSEAWVTLLDTMTPFVLSLFQDNVAAPTTRVTAISTPVPAGKLFQVEHISGYFVVGTGNVVDLIWVTDGTAQEVNLPTHFESRDLNFGGGLGIGRFHQFGSPVRMYVSGGSRITINGDSNVAGRILASVIGQLE